MEYQTHMLIDGQLVPCDHRLAVIDPSSGESFAIVSRASQRQLDDAVAAAKRAQPQWAALKMVAGRAITEASGRVTSASAPAIAATGVGLISIGWLTHSAPILDIGLDYREL
jgi:acyl-CoA reductase-like NAD-dependent aldehyde dehydrogenase